MTEIQEEETKEVEQTPNEKSAVKEKKREFLEQATVEDK